MSEPNPRVFICYSPEDAEFVAWLSEALRDLGHNIWVDQEKIVGGLQTIDVIHSALDHSEVMVLIITPDSLRSRLVNSEWTYFYGEREKKLIPIVLHPLKRTDKLNFMLAALQSIDFHREGRETALGKLNLTLSEVYSSLENKDKGLDGILGSFPTPNQWTAQDELATKQAGLVGVHLGMPIEIYTGWMRQTKQLIRLLNTWTGIFYDHIHLLVDAIQRGCHAEILLLDPSSPFARQRSLDLSLGRENSRPDENEVPKNIQTSIRQLASLYSELEAPDGNLELRLYSVLPSFSVHQCDEHALIGFFPHSARTTTFPILEVEIGTPLGNRFNEEFETIWNNATAIDLSPRIPPHITNANQTLDDPLSTRELEILALISTGLSNQEIAQKLVVTLATVKKHINNLYSKLGVTSRTQAIVHAQQLGLV